MILKFFLHMKFIFKTPSTIKFTYNTRLKTFRLQNASHKILSYRSFGLISPDILRTSLKSEKCAVQVPNSIRRHKATYLIEVGIKIKKSIGSKEASSTAVASHSLSLWASPASSSDSLYFVLRVCTRRVSASLVRYSVCKIEGARRARGTSRVQKRSSVARVSDFCALDLHVVA